jgi:hypothetical protein
MLIAKYNINFLLSHISDLSECTTIVKNIDLDIRKIDLAYFPYLKKNKIEWDHLDVSVYPTNSWKPE